MKKCRISVILLVLLSLCFSIGSSALGQNQSSKNVKLKKQNMSGPRLGLTYITGNTELYDNAEEQGMGRVISQFGWHFEWLIEPEFFDGPAFVTEFVPLISGVEYNKFIPSSSLIFGIRFPVGFEFGMGPNLSASTNKIRTSLVFAVGYSINFGGIRVPIDLAYVKNPIGDRLAFLFGYAIN